VISDLSDQATTSLLELGAWAEGEGVQYDSSRPAEHTVSGQPIGTEENDTDSQILQAANVGNIDVLQDWISRLRGTADAKGRFTRIFLAAIPEAPEDALRSLLSSTLVDLHAEDDINERNCLHEATISGRSLVLDAALGQNVDVTRVDVYGRLPLHYACMHGRIDLVEALLLKDPSTINGKDHDNYTPLIHGIVHHELRCVQQLLIYGARIDPDSETDHVPLNLACQYGSSAIAGLLLEQKAKLLPDAEGLYPQHLVARSGAIPEALLMLERNGADLDQRDKLYQWTPLFHAAAEGRVDCLETLLGRRVDVNILDEKNLSALYYATWEGHMQCMGQLSSAGVAPPDSSASGLSRSLLSPVSATVPSQPASLDADGIPDLSLPPPIMPLRRYGHSFLDTKTFVQLSFDAAGADSIYFYHDSKYPAARLTISSKLSDVIPRNIMLPIQEDSRIISFQVDSLDSFAVDLEIYPTFGSKVIAKSVALPNIFNAISSSSGRCCLPLFDPRLRAIGQISFNFQVIKPFHGIPLEITQFATYWKATSQFDTHPNDFVTGSSLSGDYVEMFVQMTSDAVPVLCPMWSINHQGIDLPICRLSYEQYLSLGSQRGHGVEVLATLRHTTTDSIVQIHETLAECFLSLEDVLAHLPTSVPIDIQVLFPTIAQERSFGLSPSPNINDFADSILSVVFDHTRKTKAQSPDFMRSVVFTSYNADICTALNWKQPNCKCTLSLIFDTNGLKPGRPRPPMQRSRRK
jgi:CDK inhibitor PHO81